MRAQPEQILSRLHALAGVAAEFVFIHEQAVVLEDLASAESGASPIQVPAAPPPSGFGGVASDQDGTGFLSTQRETSVRLPYDKAAIRALVDGGTLRDYQGVGVAHMLSQAGACMGDDMGLGKSRQTVVATRLAAGETGSVLIVCPASLRLNWEREIRMIYPDASIGMVGEDRMATLRACDWVIGNYERMGGLVRETDLEFAVMAIDEAHYLKEYQSGRTRN